MLITLELLFCTDLRRSLATVGEVNIEKNPALESAIADYLEQNATTPPGVWVRSYKGRNWLTQIVPGLPFFAFLADWRSVPWWREQTGNLRLARQNCKIIDKNRYRAEIFVNGR
ncbi:hypothetical protein NN677_001438 [Salmonella enterica]|nr:hypothetical protein [Salmonella enterica]